MVDWVRWNTVTQRSGLVFPNSVFQTTLVWNFGGFVGLWLRFPLINRNTKPQFIWGWTNPVDICIFIWPNGFSGAELSRFKQKGFQEIWFEITAHLQIINLYAQLPYERALNKRFRCNLLYLSKTLVRFSKLHESILATTRSLDCRLCYKKLLESLRRKNRVETFQPYFLYFRLRQKLLVSAKWS